MRAAKQVYLYNPQGEYVATYRTIGEFAKSFNVGSNIFSPTNNKKGYIISEEKWVATLSRVNKSTVQKWLGIKPTPKNNIFYTMDIVIRDNSGKAIVEAVVAIDSKLLK